MGVARERGIVSNPFHGSQFSVRKPLLPWRTVFLSTKTHLTYDVFHDRIVVLGLAGSLIFLIDGAGKGCLVGQVTKVRDGGI
ncbi:MAG: hypothetical protein ACI87E_000472 [Mariniblastus sp.]|jgi:hypothetical protein